MEAYTVGGRKESLLSRQIASMISDEVGAYSRFGRKDIFLRASIASEILGLLDASFENPK